MRGERARASFGMRRPADAPRGSLLCRQVLWTDASGNPKKSERSEPFRVLQLEIRNLPTIEAALEAYVAGDPISGCASIRSMHAPAPWRGGLA